MTNHESGRLAVAAFTQPRLEGLEFADGSEILLRETDAALAAACCELLLDEARAGRIGLAAWERARASYDRATTVRALRDIFRS